MRGFRIDFSKKYNRSLFYIEATVIGTAQKGNPAMPGKENK